MKLSFLRFLAAVLLFSTVCDAQQRSPTLRKVRVGMSSEGYFRVGPDPNSAWDLAKFVVEEPQVARYLAIPKEELDTLIELVAESGTKEQEIFRELKKAGRADEITASVLQYRAELSEGAKEIFPPKQMKKLREIAMRIEVLRMGLPDSLVRGRLAETIGIYESQKSDLIRKAKQIEQATQAKIVELLKESEVETLALLTPEQRRQAEDLLGDTNDFIELPRARQLFQQLLEEEGVGDFSKPLPPGGKPEEKK